MVLGLPRGGAAIWIRRILCLFPRVASLGLQLARIKEETAPPLSAAAHSFSWNIPIRP
jgi:hypothetical protein